MKRELYYFLTHYFYSGDNAPPFIDNVSERIRDDGSYNLEPSEIIDFYKEKHIENEKSIEDYYKIEDFCIQNKISFKNVLSYISIVFFNEELCNESKEVLEKELAKYVITVLNEGKENCALPNFVDRLMFFAALDTPESKVFVNTFCVEKDYFDLIKKSGVFVTSDIFSQAGFLAVFVQKDNPKNHFKTRIINCEFVEELSSVYDKAWEKYKKFTDEKEKTFKLIERQANDDVDLGDYEPDGAILEVVVW